MTSFDCFDVIDYNDEGVDIFLRFYADEAERALWASDYEGALPPMEQPPHDRDRHLPSLKSGADAAAKGERTEISTDDGGDDTPYRFRVSQ